MTGNPRRSSGRSFLLLLALALMLAPAGCGGDEDDESAADTESAPAETRATESEPSDPETEAETDDEGPETETGPDSPEDQPEGPEDEPGGAGDEEPARSLALFTGRGGQIVPRVIRVPAFISVRVELRSADGRDYGLSFDGETLRVRGGLGSVSTSFDGLRPGEKLVGRPLGVGNRVRVEATAEPGP
jgi:hypothetical protein